MKKAVFLDRDDTLIEDVPYLANPSLVRLIPGVPGALREFRNAGFALVVVTNQSGIGRGMYSVEEMARVNSRMEELFAHEGVVFDGMYYCPHSPEEPCSCRKPKPGLLQTAVGEMGIDISESVMIGDKISDVEAGIAAGCWKSILLLHGRGEGFYRGKVEGPGFMVAEDIPSAAEAVLRSFKQG